MDCKKLKWRKKYRNAVGALQELIDFDKTIQDMHIIINNERDIVLALDLYGSAEGNEKIVQKIEYFIPDFILDERGDE